MEGWHKNYYLSMGLSEEDWRQVQAADNEGMTNMATVTKFEDKVKEALSAVMKHAVTGHPERLYGTAVSVGYGETHHTFCNDADHALHILAEAGIKPVNASTVDKLFDLDNA